MMKYKKDKKEGNKKQEYKTEETSNKQEQLKKNNKQENFNQENTEEREEFIDVRRKSSRVKKCPEYFQEYVMLFYTEAINGPDKQKWKETINNEKKSLEENQT